MRRVALRNLGAAALAVVCLGLPLSQAEAGDQWCEDDPLVVVQTPNGNLVPLFVTNGARGLEHLPALQLANIEYSVNATGQGTMVTLQVKVPGDVFARRFETRTTVSTGPLKTGTVFGTTTGYSEDVMTVKFKLDAP